MQGVQPLHLVHLPVGLSLLCHVFPPSSQIDALFSLALPVAPLRNYDRDRVIGDLDIHYNLVRTIMFKMSEDHRLCTHICLYVYIALLSYI